MSILKGKELTDKRIECNREILRKLSEYLTANPDMRFSQALMNLNIVNGYNDYYLEPDEVLKRMKS